MEKKTKIKEIYIRIEMPQNFQCSVKQIVSLKRNKNLPPLPRSQWPEDLVTQDDLSQLMEYKLKLDVHEAERQLDLAEYFVYLKFDL